MSGDSLTNRIAKGVRSYTGYSDAKADGNSTDVNGGDGRDGCGNQDADIDIDGDSDSEAGNLASTLKELGGMALTVASASLAENLYEWRAERLRRNQDADVIRKFPAHMRAALESLNDNRDPIPSMFHFAKKIHIF